MTVYKKISLVPKGPNDTDAVWINNGIAEVVAGGGGTLDLEGKVFALAGQSITMASNLVLDATHAKFRHSGKLVLSAFQTANWRIIGRPVFEGLLNDEYAYAFKVTECSAFYMEIEYRDGNCGILLDNCTDGSAYFYGFEILGPGIKVKGPFTERLNIGAKVRNGGGFGIHGEKGAKNVTVEFTEKWVDDGVLAARPTLLDILPIEDIKKDSAGTEIHKTIGEEALGLTVDTSHWLIKRLYAHRTGDAGCSLTGDYHHLLDARVIECALGGVHSSGKNNRVDYVYSRRNGKYNTPTAIYGGVAASVGSSAGANAVKSSFGKVVSDGDLVAGFRIDDDWRYKPFVPNGECKSRFMIWNDNVDEVHVFRVKGTTPAWFGPNTPAQAGWPEPTDPEVASTFIDGLTANTNLWEYRSSYSNTITTNKTMDSGVEELFIQGTPTFVIDNVGPGYGNYYPTNKKPYKGPILLLNGDFLNWPNGTEPLGTITVSSTPQQFAGGWYAARASGGVTVSQITYDGFRRGAVIKRTAGSSATSSIAFAHAIRGQRLIEILDKPVAFKMLAWRGSQWSDNNDQFSWGLYWNDATGAFDSDLIPTDFEPLASGAVGGLTSTPSLVSFSSETVIVPPTAKQVNLRIYYTPLFGVAKSITVTNQGSGYVPGVPISFTGYGTATPPQAHAVVSPDGKITQIILDTTGSGMTSAPTVVIGNGTSPGSGATAVCRVPLVADEDDWMAFARPVCAPADTDFDFVSEPIELTELRLAALAAS